MIVLTCIDISHEDWAHVLTIGPFRTKDDAIDHVLGNDTQAREQVRANGSNNFRLNEMVFIATEMESPIEYISPAFQN